MLVDTHCHILPGIDDGSPNIATSKKMLEMERKLGIGKIMLTPHFYLSEEKTVEHFLEKRQGAIEQLEPVAAQLGLEVKYGAEVLYTKSLADIDLTKLCIGDTGYMLIELPYQRLTSNFINEFRSFVGGLSPDIRLILAHAERYLNYTDEDSIYEIMDSDMIVQLNSGDFKMFSKHTKFMYDLLRRDLAHLLGTDCHNTTSRPPNIDIAEKAISKKISPRCFSRLNHNAEKVFAGKSV